MIVSDNPNLSRPEALFQEYAHLDIDTHRFTGKTSYDGQVGGVPLLYSKEKRQLAVDASDNHTLVIGASGSKKTRSLVLPTIKVLGYAGESMIINDPKGELYARTAGELRDLEYRIITVNLRDPTVGHAWNPLRIPYLYYKSGDVDKAAEFANDISSTLMLGTVSQKDPFWDYSAYDCCLGLILLLFKLCKEMDYPDSAASISNLLRLRRKLFEKETGAKFSPLWRWASEDELISASLTGSIMTAQDTMRGILAVLDQKLRALTIQSSLLDMLANSNFDLEEIGQSKTAVYLITPDEKTTYSSIVAMFISQSYQQLIYSAMQGGGRLSVRVNYILDEFSSLPAIGSDFPSMISAARSRNIRFLICIQSKSQLTKRYNEEAATIISNCTNWIVLFTRELELLREVSELCGQKKDHSPNISVYDLQHLSKEKDEALLLAGKAKPCLVNLLDIDRFGDRIYRIIDFPTLDRQPRFHIDFTDLPKLAKTLTVPEVSQPNISNHPKADIDVSSDISQSPGMTIISENTSFDIADLIDGMETEEKQSKLNHVVETIKKRQAELYHDGGMGSSNE